QPLRPAHHTLRIAAPPGGIQPPPPTSPLTSLARRSRFVQPRGKQRARVKPLHIPNRSAGRAAYLAFLFGTPVQYCECSALPLPRPRTRQKRQKQKENDECGKPEVKQRRIVNSMTQQATP